MAKSSYWNPDDGNPTQNPIQRTNEVWLAQLQADDSSNIIAGSQLGEMDVEDMAGVGIDSQLKYVTVIDAWTDFGRNGFFGGTQDLTFTFSYAGTTVNNGQCSWVNGCSSTNCWRNEYNICETQCVACSFLCSQP